MHTRTLSRSARRRPAPCRVFTRCLHGRIVPRRPYTSALHDDYRVDPDDTYILGQGRAVSSASAWLPWSPETEGIAEEACRLIEVDYEILPAVFDPEKAMLPGAPVLHHKHADSRIQRPGQNIFVQIESEYGDVEKGFRGSGRRLSIALTSPTRFSTRISRRTSAIAYQSEDGRMHVRTSSQAPFQTKAKLRTFSACILRRFTFTPSGSAVDSAASRRCCARNCVCSAR